jgi:hypothetical protein
MQGVGSLEEVIGRGREIRIRDVTGANDIEAVHGSGTGLYKQSGAVVGCRGESVLDGPTRRSLPHPLIRSSLSLFAWGSILQQYFESGAEEGSTVTVRVISAL